MPVEELEQQLEELSSDDLLEGIDEESLEDISAEIDLYEEYL